MGSTPNAQMAKLSVKSSNGRYVVTITGHLSGRNLRTLEQACGPALEQRPLPLTFRVAPSCTFDQPAQAYLDRLARCGALMVFL
jgi:hypothetical protein